MKFQIVYEPDWTPFWQNEPASNVQERQIKLIYRLSASTMSAVCTSPCRRAWRGRAVVTRDFNIWHFRTCLGFSAFELGDTWPVGCEKKLSGQTCGRHIKVAKIMVNGLGHFVQVRSIGIFRAHMRHEQILLNYLIQLLAACISSLLATLRCVIFLDAISGTIKSIHILQSPIVRRRFSGPGKSEKG